MSQPAVELPRLVFVGGFHAAGKSTFCRGLAPLLGLEHLKASALLMAATPAANQVASGKAVADIEANQEIIVAGVRRRMNEMRPARLPGLLLDGHFGLFNTSGGFVLIPSAVFRALAPEIFVLIEAAPDKIEGRMAARGGSRPSLIEIEQCINAEREHAISIAALLGVSLIQARGDLPTEREAQDVASAIGAHLSPKDV